jgi:hypothetical protein
MGRQLSEFDNHRETFASIPKSLFHAVAHRPIESRAIETLVEWENSPYVFESMILNFKP